MSINNNSIEKNTMNVVAGLSALASLATIVSGSSPLCAGRTKMETSELTSAGVVTLRDFDFIAYHDDVEDKDVSYPVCIFDEITDKFYCGGAQLNNLCSGILNGGLYEELKNTGLRLQFTMIKTRTGNSFVNFAVIG